MNRIKVSYTGSDFEIDDFGNRVWQKAFELYLNSYWSGIAAETERHAKAKLVWTEIALYIMFEGNQKEPLVVNSKPNTIEKAMFLWERDVFEIFVAPDSGKTERYFEFEVAPTGEWLDVELEILPDGEYKSNFDYNSGMKTAAKIMNNKILAAIKIEWQAFGKKPDEGEVWRGNLFRCIGAGETRGYLTWQPTMTEKPNFHIPEAFGEFEFVKE
ncbi:MAG: carbohydrate-binding family 9-like protein [Pyrinomonadaceae bacterium]